MAGTQSLGQWTQPGVAVEGESLWEFLHHRDDVLHDPNGRTIVPMLIFDQFEEIFTLAQADDAGRARAQQFIEDLADLVENRAPAALVVPVGMKRRQHRIVVERGTRAVVGRGSSRKNSHGVVAILAAAGS